MGNLRKILKYLNKNITVGREASLIILMIAFTVLSVWTIFKIPEALSEDNMIRGIIWAIQLAVIGGILSGIFINIKPFNIVRRVVCFSFLISVFSILFRMITFEDWTVNAFYWSVGVGWLAFIVDSFIFEGKKKTQDYFSEKPSTGNILDKYGEIIHENIQTIELKPRPPKGKSNQNQVIISYANSESKSCHLTNEHFYFLYLLCVQRLSGNDERWVPHKSYIDMQYINQMEKLLGRKIPRQYSWIERETQKSTVKTKINKNIAPLIIRTDEETVNSGQNSYYSLISVLSDKKSIILHKMN